MSRGQRGELLEELGFSVSLESLRPLGPSTFPAPGFVSPGGISFSKSKSCRACATGRHSTAQQALYPVVVAVSLEEALELCRSGVIEDSKTELALRRLAERLA